MSISLPQISEVFLWRRFWRHIPPRSIIPDLDIAVLIQHAFLQNLAVLCQELFQCDLVLGEDLQ